MHLLLLLSFFHTAVHLHIELIPSPSALFLFPSTPHHSLVPRWGSAQPSSISVCQLARNQILLQLCDRTKTTASRQITQAVTRCPRKCHRSTNTQWIFLFYCMLWPILPDKTEICTQDSSVLWSFAKLSCIASRKSRYKGSRSRSKNTNSL